MKMKMRKLKSTSWLAQSLDDMMAHEVEKHGINVWGVSQKYNALQTTKIIVEMADKNENGIHYEIKRDRRIIIIPNIPNLITQYGSDFSIEKMQARLLGLAAKYTDDDGIPTVYVNITHDLNSATIDISRLMDQIRLGGEN